MSVVVGQSPPGDLSAVDPFVSLAELLSEGVSLEWYESLAIVQGLCGAVLESADQMASSTIGLDTVWIGPDGDVFAIVGPQSPMAAVHRVGETLGQLLSDF